MLHRLLVLGSALLLVPVALQACGSEAERAPPPDDDGIFGFAKGCYAVEVGASDDTSARWIVRGLASSTFALGGESIEDASRFFLQPADLGTYLLYDEERRYLVAEEAGLERRSELLSDILTIDDSYVSGGEWEVAVSKADPERFSLRNRRSGRYLAASGSLTGDESSAATVSFHPRSGCSEPPELTLDAEGEVVPRSFDDGDLFGIVDSHSHMLTNFGFGGGGIFHGAPFHRLGVEHALPDCELFHGSDGRSDILGFAYDKGSDQLDVEAFLPALLSGFLPEFSHHTAGYPDFTDWPNAPFSSTHQTQYYRWLERAYRGGLRLVVQHATSNSALCDLVRGQGIQQVRYECNDMVAVDRSIDEAYALERYIDAQHGGPGRGWLRIVKSPSEAREIIRGGRLAVVLGIEVSNLFDCFLTPPEGFEACDEGRLREQLDRYYERGVRAIFPVHKYDNGFSPGDGHRAISELGNFANSGHWSSFGLDCPSDATPVFDRGNVQFGGLNAPREVYDSPAPNDVSDFPDAPVATIAPHLEKLRQPPLEGPYCQSHGLTPLGETLLREMMKRGMIVEIDHLPQWSYKRAFEILSENSYPAVATHGSEYNGRIYENGGLSKMNFGRCADPNRPGSLADGLRERVARSESAGGYPAAGFGFDLNGFAGAPRPRFGEQSECSEPQSDPVEYPFRSYAGDVTFTEPVIGNRSLDFNTEGMVHIGLLPELIEDVRRTGSTDAELEALFRSAEGYVRMWERAEERAKASTGR